MSKNTSSHERLKNTSLASESKKGYDLINVDIYGDNMHESLKLQTR